MAKILVQTPVRNIDAGSQSVIFSVYTDKVIQTYNVDQYNTTIYLKEKYSSPVLTDYNYLYTLIINISNNTTNSIKQHNILATFNFIDESLSENIRITQQYNNVSAYIRNITVSTEDGLYLPKNSMNQYEISLEHFGKLLYIRYDCDYPADTQNIVNSNYYDYTEDEFIQDVYTEGKGLTLVYITDDESFTGVQSIQLDYDDNWGIGSASTIVTFTVNKDTYIDLEVGKDTFNDYNANGGTITTELYYSGITASDIIFDYTESWIENVYIYNNDYVRIVISRNTGDSRSAIIWVIGSNEEGYFKRVPIYITQAGYSVPYVGGTKDLVTLYDELLPVIRTDYKGNVKSNPLKLFNYLDNSGNVQVSSFSAFTEDVPDFITLKPIAGTKNASLDTKPTYKYNYYDYEQLDIIDVDITLSNGEYIYTRIAIVAEASPENITAPLWKDTLFECNKQYFRFKDLNTDALLYTGVIYPNANNTINVSEILSSYVNMNKFPFTNNINSNNNFVEAVLETSDTPSFEYYTQEKIYHLYWDYSYDYSVHENLLNPFSPGYFLYSDYEDHNAEFANPINYYDSRQYIFIHNHNTFKTNASSERVIGITNDNRTVTLFTIPKDTLKYYTTFSVKPGDFKEIQLYEAFDDYKLWVCGELKCTKANYAVYYLNSYGIWCWMLFEGKQMESVKTTINKYQNNTQNTLSYNINTPVYQNNVEETYNLTSLYLNDEQSKKLKDLYTSPLIYVHELENDVIYNVYLNTNTYDIKTFVNQGRKFYTHSIKLTKSINKSIKL